MQIIVQSSLANHIIRNSTSLNHVWQIIHAHYGFQSSDARILDISLIKFESDEKYEDLYQRLASFFEDNLLTPESVVLHHGREMDEETTPLVENLTVTMWLHSINPQLPALVKQRFGTELRHKSLASIKPEISQVISSLVDELRNKEGQAMRTFSTIKNFK
jgi:hypothetical protein